MNAQDLSRFRSTRSPLKAWFLQTFCGQRIHWRSCKPYTCMFGLVLYETRFFLVSDDTTARMLHMIH